MSIQTSNLTSVLPLYLNPLLDLNVNSSTVSSVLLVILLLVIFFTVFILIANYLRLKRAIKDKFVFIEVKPPYRSLQSVFSTNQLFGVIHSLERHASLIDKLLKIKLSTPLAVN